MQNLGGCFLNACETMGGANAICTDKTGILSLNLMFVTRIITSNEKKEISSNINDKNITLKDAKNINTAKRLREAHKNIFPNDNYWIFYILQ